MKWQSQTSSPCCLQENKRLEALVQKYRQEQVVFCKELAAGNPNPGGTPANDTYIRKAGIQAAHNAGFTFPMWVLAGSDIVSNEVNFNGQWEGTETLFILDRLKEWKEVSAGAHALLIKLFMHALRRGRHSLQAPGAPGDPESLLLRPADAHHGHE